jgi:hypothetical protein
MQLRRKQAGFENTIPPKTLGCRSGYILSRPKIRVEAPCSIGL